MLRESDYAYQNTYLRRISPPGSPALTKKCCCYDKKSPGDSGAAKESIFCCCYTYPGSRNTSILATLGVCLLVIIYTIIGAFTFMAIEGSLYHETHAEPSKIDPKIKENKAIIDIRTETVDRLWSITENLNILYRENWTRLASEEVMVFQDALFKAFKNSDSVYSARTGTMSTAHKDHKWSFSSSFLYSLTLITTIGYGSVSPRTSWGKLVTIIYALIGIPLMLLYLSTTGDLLARSFRKLYGKMCGISVRRETPHCPCANTVRVPVLLCLIIVLAYICSGALLFHRLENWSLLEGSYFCFTSLGTIGFGDLLPGQKAEDISMCACSAYILTGMALVAMCFSLVQEEVIKILRYLGGSCSRTDLRKTDEEGIIQVKVQ
ncbi:unnamed protein product [Brassicogethes aeneus]|uniref:Potassium channel domain-containing protein n=1 Tax=Brassicogethes aeneus TaxID=1431903 RepID=A0A9P0AVI9_BRAAE|nr:unnamed protein product [Brassicogethes aeneus]